MSQPTNTPRTAKDIMVTKLVTLPPDSDVFDGIEALIKHRISGAPVVDADNRLLGLFSEKSCMQVLIDAAYDQLPTTRVDAFMDRDPQTIDENTDLLTIAQIFLNTERRRLPVVRDGQLLGQISRRDVIRAAAELTRTAPDKKASLLYLSALRPMDDPPSM